MTSPSLPKLLAAGCVMLLPQITSFAAMAQPCTPSSQERPGSSIVYVGEMEGMVVSVDQQARRMTLRDAAGQLMPISVGSGVANFERFKPGDHVAAHYIQALAVSLAVPKRDDASTGTEQADGTRQASGGDHPRDRAGSQMCRTVTIAAVDHATHTVMFAEVNDAVRMVVIRDPEAQHFLDTLKAGDRLDLAFDEAFAVAIDPKAK